MNERPFGVTILAGLSILGGVLAALFALWFAVELAERGPSDLGLVVVVLLVTAAVQSVVGMGLLAGKNWARWMYLLAVPFNMLAGMANGNPSVLVQLLIYIPFALYLMMPRVRDFFITPVFFD